MNITLVLGIFLTFTGFKIQQWSAGYFQKHPVERPPIFNHSNSIILFILINYVIIFTGLYLLLLIHYLIPISLIIIYLLLLLKTRKINSDKSIALAIFNAYKNLKISEQGLTDRKIYKKILQIALKDKYNNIYDDENYSEKVIDEMMQSSNFENNNLKKLAFDIIIQSKPYGWNDNLLTSNKLDKLNNGIEAAYKKVFWKELMYQELFFNKNDKKT